LPATQRSVGLTREERKRKLRRKETGPEEESTAESRKNIETKIQKCKANTNTNTYAKATLTNASYLQLTLQPTRVYDELETRNQHPHSAYIPTRVPTTDIANLRPRPRTPYRNDKHAHLPFPHRGGEGFPQEKAAT
jgi:anthranilate/para-aminobenzoate synthase component I